MPETFYTIEDDLSTLEAGRLQGFFVGWSSPPTPEQHLAILRGSDLALLARTKNDDRVVGFVTAITDGVIAAYLPLLEVLPEYQRRGIGTALVNAVVERFDLYMIDAVTDEDVLPFYARLGFDRGVAVSRRNYAAVSRIPES